MLFISVKIKLKIGKGPIRNLYVHLEREGLDVMFPDIFRVYLFHTT